jgi:hypothetical protein
MFKRIALVLALMAVATAAQAGVTCTRQGNQTYCSDGEGGRTTTCTQLGNETYCD